MRHVYIKPASPNLNGKVERSHLTDQLEFYQLLDYTDDVDLREKLAAWEEFYNVHRPHAGLGGGLPTRSSGRRWYREDRQPRSGRSHTSGLLEPGRYGPYELRLPKTGESLSLNQGRSYGEAVNT